MTPPDARTRAEKIWQEWKDNMYCRIPEDHKDFVDSIAAQISEAEREVVDQFIDRQVLVMEDEPSAKKIYEEGFHAARERAAEIVENWSFEITDGPMIKAYLAADRIRQLEVEGGK